MITSTINSTSTDAAKDATMTPAQQQSRQRAYTKEVMAIGIGGVLAGLVSSGLQLIAHGHGPALTVLSFSAILGISASFLDHREGSSVLRVVLGALGGIGMVMALAVHPIFAAVLGGGFIGAAFSLRFGNSTVQRAAVVTAYAAALAIGTFIASVLLNVGFFKSFDVPVVKDILTTGMWSLALMLPGGLKFLEWQSDELDSEYKAVRAELKGKHRQTIENAHATYGRIRDELNREEQSDVRERAADIAKEVSRGLIALTRRAAELEETVARTSQSPLEDRAAELEARIRASRDKALKRELAAALEEVVEQMRTRRRMEAACVRIEARQQRFLTALERLHVALVQNDRLASSDSSIGQSLDNLSRLTEEVRWSNLSVDELCGDEQDDEAQDEQTEALLAELESLQERESTGVVLSHSAAEESPEAHAIDGVDGFVVKDDIEDVAEEDAQENLHVQHTHSK